MSYHHALFVAWVAGSICWVGYWIWHYTTTCSLIKMSNGRAITCRWETAETGGTAVVSQTAPAFSVLRDMAAHAIGVPLCLLVGAIAVSWVLDRFRARYR
jgi:UDP-N-acetylmuramyl pentapeptide phosphotransferase/UDP-N-acetylglucosamine-1-phosphate transferase